MIGRKPFYVRTAERKEARRQRLQVLFSIGYFPIQSNLTDFKD